MLVIALALLLQAAEAPVDTPSPLMTRRSSELAVVLKLDPSQRPALDRFVAAWVTGPDLPIFDREQYNRMTAPHRYGYEVHVAEADLAALQKRRKAAEELYAVLAPAQRKILDEGLSYQISPSAVAADPVPSISPQLPASLRPPSYKQPNWLIKPSGDMIMRVYPKKAMQGQVSGRTVTRCDVDLDGYLADCIVTSETPTGMGFGNAALQATSYMRMTPAMRRGVPVYGTVTVPLTFSMPDEAPRPGGADAR